MSHADRAVELKGGTVTLMSLQLRNDDPKQVSESIAEKVNQAPTFFRGAPVLVDFAELKAIAPDKLEGLIEAVRESDIVPIAARGAAEDLRDELARLKLPFLNTDAGKDIDTGDSDDKTETKVVTGAPRVEMRPVRSGQQIYARQGDLVIMGATSAGSELIADGSIHVYGPLRGRALCGIGGNEGSRIFCESLEAELISVAGTYRLFEEIPEALKGCRVQAWLDDDNLIIEPF
ncbi:MAG: septum site-determining protein MinC [Pseudomonadota bacterium]